MKTVLLPVKDFRQAKQRLAPALDAVQRAGLARAMLSDVLRAIAHARRPERVIVFTASEEVARVVRPYAFEIIEEAIVRGHSAAVNQMIDELSAQSSHILSIAGDLPTVMAQEIDTVFDGATADISLIASRDGTGTNATLFVSPARIRMEYGEGSLKRHLSNAVLAGFQAEVLKVPGIEFDIDTADDLRMFMVRGFPESETWRFLAT